MRVKITVMVCFMVCVICFNGCSSSSSRPSASDGEKVALNLLEQDMKEAKTPGLVKLVKFNKTNGQYLQGFGVGTYSLEYEAQIKYTDDCYALDEPESPIGRPVTPQQYASDFLVGKIFYKPVKKGTTKQFTGKFLFTKTEKGWRGVDGKIY